LPSSRSIQPARDRLGADTPSAGELGRFGTLPLSLVAAAPGPAASPSFRRGLRMRAVSQSPCSPPRYPPHEPIGNPYDNASKARSLLKRSREEWMGGRYRMPTSRREFLSFIEEVYNRQRAYTRQLRINRSPSRGHLHSQGGP